MSYEVLADLLSPEHLEIVHWSSSTVNPENPHEILIFDAYLHSHGIFVGKADRITISGPHALRALREKSREGEHLRQVLSSAYEEINEKEINDDPSSGKTPSPISPKGCTE